MKTLVYIIFLSVTSISALNLPKEESLLITSPVMKSVFIPGLGELSIGAKNQAKFFGSVEIALWLTIMQSAMSRERHQSNMVSYAALHASAKLEGKDDQFAVNIANYMSLEEFNQEHQRMRLVGKIYRTENYYWEWSSEAHREQYWIHLSNRARAEKIGLFAIGGMVVNRILSAINVSYLTRLHQSDFSLRFLPLHIDDPIAGSQLIFTIDF